MVLAIECISYVIFSSMIESISASYMIQYKTLSAVNNPSLIVF